MTRKKVWLAILAVTVVAGAFGLYWFQPWKLFTSKTVNDTAPAIVTQSPASSAQAPTAALVSQGTLVSHEHETSGKAQIIRLADGRHQLVLSDLSTSDGPDLRVWLTDQAVTEDGWHVFDDGKYVEVGRLKGTRGTLVYDLPPDLAPAAFTSVTIWCKRFSVSFGAAPLPLIAQYPG